MLELLILVVQIGFTTEYNGPSSDTVVVRLCFDVVYKTKCDLHQLLTHICNLEIVVKFRQPDNVSDAVCATKLFF